VKLVQNVDSGVICLLLTKGENLERCEYVISDDLFSTTKPVNDGSRPQPIGTSTFRSFWLRIVFNAVGVVGEKVCLRCGYSEESMGRAL
jgi:hypothetical protein